VPAWTYRSFAQEKLRMTYVTDPGQARELVASILDWQPEAVAIDFETAHRIRLVQLGFEIADGRARQLVFDCDHVPSELLVPVFADASMLKLVHHSQFEQGWAVKETGVAIERVFDSCLAWKAIQAALEELGRREGQAAIDRVLPGWRKHPNTLEALCRLVLGFALPKDEQNSAWASQTLSPSQLNYAAMDVAVLAPLVARTMPILDALGLRAGVDEKARLVGVRALARHV
jgi:ribonuclease D